MAGLKVLIANDVGLPCDVALESRALCVVGPEFVAVDRGTLFVFDNEQPVVAAGGVVETLLQVPDVPTLRGIRLGGVFSSTAAALLEMFHNPTWSDPGASEVEINRNLLVANTSVVGASTQPTITDEGDRLIVRLLPGGRKGSATAGSSDEVQPQIIVPGGDDILMRMTNLADRDQYMVLGLIWIELPDPFPDP